MSYCSRSCRRWFILLNFKSSAFCRICGHFQQHFTAHMQNRLFRKFRYNRRFDYVFRWFFCILYAEYHSLPDPDFLTKCEISAIWRRFPLIVAFYMLKVRRISTSVFLFLPTAPSLKLIWPSTAELLRYCCWYVAWPCDLDFWRFYLDQLSYMRGR